MSSAQNHPSARRTPESGGASPFYSRHIGLDERSGQQIPIQYGTRLTGQVGAFEVGFYQIGTGDHTYFKNPDFDPAHSAFQGENVIYLGDGMYFGHGLGVVSEQGVIDSLNGLRKPGATKTAYRDDFELRLDGGKIAGLDLDPD